MLREEQIDKAKGIVRTYVDFHKDSSSSILNHNQLESILDKSIENLKNSKILDISEDDNFFEIVKNSVLSEEISILPRDKDINIITDKDHEPWLIESTGQPLNPDRKKIRYEYWKRYRKFIENQKKINLEDFDRDVRQIVANLGDPLKRNKNGWINRGMVVGSVQSGKTMNYTGVISQAVDAGYQFIVVLGGSGRKLRAQTQARIDEGLLGRCTVKNKYVGAGKIKLKDENGQDVKYKTITSLTTSHDGSDSKRDGDFSVNSKQVAGYNTDWNENTQTHIVILKKNKAILNNFLDWIEKIQENKEDKAELSLLLIDDECDYASIDTNKADELDDILEEDYEASAINECITKILKKFKWRSYLGYTATPYGNIFQRRDINEIDESLFPRDYIIYLEPNRMYFGPNEFFNSHNEEDPVNLIKAVPDEDSDYFYNITSTWREICNKKKLRGTKDDTDEEKEQKKALRKQELIEILNNFENDRAPSSLSKAIQTFILSCAIRWNRGERKVFNSMLIHIDRIVLYQDFLIRMIEREFLIIKNKIENQNIDKLKKIYINDFIETTNNVINSEEIEDGIKIGIDELPEFEKLMPSINEVIDRISIVKEFGKSKNTRLDFSDNKKGNFYICIGSDVLSRGLTLEGLTISYFLRAAKTYDTLMQMGRWFGYRVGYLDVCRVYTTPTIIDFFNKVKEANNKMYKMFQDMQERDEIPENFGMFILSSSDVLKVTGYGKRRYAQDIKMDYSGDTHNELYTDLTESRLDYNFNYLNKFLEDKEIDLSENALQSYNLSNDNFIDFISNYKFTYYEGRQFHSNFIKDLYAAYIEKLKTSIKGFKIVIIGNNNKNLHSWKINNHNIKVSRRLPEVSRLVENKFWHQPSSSNDGKIDKILNNKYLENGYGYISLRPLVGMHDYSTHQKNGVKRTDIEKSIQDKTFKEKGFDIIGLELPVFHEVVRMPNRYSIGLMEDQSKLSLTVDRVFIEDIQQSLQFPTDSEGYIND